MPERSKGNEAALPQLEDDRRLLRWLPSDAMTVLRLVAALIGVAIFFVLFVGLKEAGWQGFDWEAAQRFISGRNLSLIFRQTAIVGIAALGMTAVIVSGGIDLSVGSVIALVTVVIAWVLQAGATEDAQTGMLTLGGSWAWPLFAIAVGLLAGVLCGLLNGAIIVGFGVTPFIVTLGTLLLLRGLAKGFAGSQKIDAPPTWLTELLATPRSGSWLSYIGPPPGVWIMLILTALTAAMLRYTRFGRHIFAIGSNEQTARLCGIGIGRAKLAVYAFMGLMAGIAGVMQFGRLTVGDPTVAVSVELNVIAAVVIGGATLAGGEGSVVGALVGALIIMTIRSGCTQLGLDNYVQEMVTGAIIVLAVGLDRWRHRKAV